jgi:hypothetical protein
MPGTTAPTFADGVEVTIAGITVDSPLEVLNGRSGIVVGSRRIDGVELVTVHLDYAVTSDELELMFGRGATFAALTEDPDGHRIELPARMLAPRAALLHPAGGEFLSLMRAVVAEVRAMARRDGGELWTMARDLVTVPWVKANMPRTVTTTADARAWIHYRATTDAFGF